jgi:hypothetical protein
MRSVPRLADRDVVCRRRATLQRYIRRSYCSEGPIWGYSLACPGGQLGSGAKYSEALAKPKRAAPGRLEIHERIENRVTPPIE